MTNNNVTAVFLPNIATTPSFTVSDGSDEFQRYDEVNYICNSTTEEVKRKVHKALESLSLHHQQSSLVQFWAPTKAGNAFLLTTTFQLYGVYRINTGLDVYRKGCLQHKLFIDPNQDVSFGLPGLVFKEKTRQQTRDMNFYYPKNVCPHFESDTIFPMKWGSFAVPVFLNYKCVGVLEFVTTKSMNSYDGDMDLVEEALKHAGLQSSKEIKSSKEIDIPKTKRTDAPTETTSSNKKRRKTQKMKYAFYNRVASFFGLRKKEAMKRVKRKFNLTKDVKETTFTEVLRKLGITEWPYAAKKDTEASTSFPKTRINPTVSEIPTGLEHAENAPLIHNTNEKQFVRDSDATENQCNNVSLMGLNYTENQVMADLDGTQSNETLGIANFSEPPMNPTSSEIPAVLEPAENAHLIHDTNKRQLGIYSDVTENDAPLMAPVAYTEDQEHLITAPVDETLDMAISYEIPSPTLDELVRAIMRSPDRFFMPEIIGRNDHGDENPLMTIHMQTTTMMS